MGVVTRHVHTAIGDTDAEIIARMQSGSGRVRDDLRSLLPNDPSLRGATVGARPG